MATFQKIIILCLILDFYGCFSLHAQQDSSIINYNKNSWKKPPYKLVKLFGDMDSRNSLINSQQASIFGLRGGIVLDTRWRFGLGAYMTLKPVLFTKANDANVNVYNRFWYTAICFEYIALRTKRWEISLPTYFGVGQAREQFFDKNTHHVLGKQNITIGLFETMGLVSFRFCRWNGLGLGLGFRTLYNKDKELKDAYNSGIYTIRIKFYLGELYKTVRHKIYIKKHRND